MCLGNRAEASASYINAQLSALWTNAQRCAEKHSTGLRPTVSAIEYGTCLYEHYGAGKHSRYNPTKEDLSFFAKFNAPRLEFVCNHEVILFFDAVEGHFKVESAKVNGKVEPEIAHKLQPSTCAIRLNFGIETIENLVCKAVGNMSHYTMNLLVLLIDSFEFCHELSRIPSIDAIDATATESNYVLKQRTTAALTHHLKSYLNLIKRAGHHVLHCLPDFDNLTVTSAHIDYSVISKTNLSVQEIYGIDVAKVNEYLRGLWLQNAMYVAEHGIDGEGSDRVKKALLSEHKTVWDGLGEDVNMHMVFGPMQIQPLCKREVILYLDIPELHFHVGGWHEHHTHKFTETRIALIVNIVFEKVEGEYVKRVKLDLSSARICEHFCSLKWEIKDTSLLVKLQRTLITYITKRYITLIRESHYECIYHHDTRIVVKGSIDGRDSPDTIDVDDDCHYGAEETLDWEGMYGCGCESKDVCGHESETTAVGGVHIRWRELERTRVSSHTHLAHFDSITAVTQRSINHYFYALWELARIKVGDLGSKGKTWDSKVIEARTCLSEYALVGKEHGDEVFFWASFGAMRVQLPVEQGSQHVIVYLTLQDGHLKVLGDKNKLQPGGKEHQIHNWRIAFRVDLKLVSCNDNHKVSDAVLKATGRTSHSGFKQLTLDFSTAKILPNHSFIPGLLDGIDTRLILKKYQALVHYLTHDYFSALTRGGYHVLHTLALSHSEYKSHLSTKHVGFQIVPFAVGHAGATWECAFGKTRYLADRNMIVFVGMHEHTLPNVVLERGIPWVCGVGRDIPDGTICLSRKTFLESRLLTLLERVNRHTTVLPSFSGVDNGRWIIQLTTWDKHEMKRTRKAVWKTVKAQEAGQLAFAHWNREEWKYEHEGDDASTDGAYQVKCNTHNKLTIPTGQNDGVATLALEGKVDLSMGYVGAGKHWSAHVGAAWHATISLVSDPVHGVKVHIAPAQVKPIFQETVHTGEQGAAIFKHAREQLERELPDVVDLGYVLEELKAEFEGVWGGVCIGDRETVVTRPVFNAKGDLLLELRLKQAIFESASAKAVSGAVGVGAKHDEGWFRPLVHKVSDFVSGADHKSHGSANGTANGSAHANGSLKTDVLNGSPKSAGPLSPPPTYSAVLPSPGLSAKLSSSTSIKRSSSQMSVSSSKSSTMVVKEEVKRSDAVV